MSGYPKLDHIDPLSLTSVHLECFACGNSLSVASGFIIKFKDRFYVITNWHVVSGKNADTGQLLAQHGAVPDTIKIKHHSKHQLGEWIETTELLLDDDYNPLWLEHASGREVDIVAIPITPNDDIELHPLDFGLINTDVIMRPGMLVSIIGFPKGLSSSGWPIWKMG